MKAIFHLGARALDISPLATQFPNIRFAVTRTPADVAQEIGDAELLIVATSAYTRDFVAMVNANARALKWVQFTTSGIDSVLKNGGFPPGVIVTNSAGLRAANLSEHAFAMLLFLARRFRVLESQRAAGKWRREPVYSTEVSLNRRMLLIIGMGAVGQAAATKARAFGMRVIAVSRAYGPDEYVSAVYPRDGALEAFAQADVVLVSATSDAQTRNYLDAEKFAVMKPSAFVINVARGDIIDEAALIEACASGRIAGAGLDVCVDEPPLPDSALWTLDNVFLSPHIGAGGNDDSAT
ncbi:MAG TPA: D-2-hydroxyacid dehydrogenase, partial [Beijerinckiaceae bacterium]|nr:D-2-hydroxyacid dehydrogenase [Beijerinckiaceae bacterium]